MKPAEKREFPTPKKGNSDDFLREKLLTKNTIAGRGGACVATGDSRSRGRWRKRRA